MQTVELAGRVLVSLAAVLAVIWFLARKLNRGNKRASTSLIDVLGRQRLSNNASVAVVRIGDKALVIGVTDAQVNVLGETDLAAALAHSSTSAPAVSSSPRIPGRRMSRRTSPTPSARSTHRSRPATRRTPITPGVAEAPGRLAGSALSPQTWRQTVESLRDLTAH